VTSSVIRFVLLSLMLLQVPDATNPGKSTFSRYRRRISPIAGGQACTVLDAATLSHAAPFLKDLRLYGSSAGDSREIPYVLTLSEAQQAESEPARILNLGMRGHAVAFDLAMPNRPYTEVDLDLAGQNFIATAAVTGMSASGSSQGTRLGGFNLFDLTSQHLSRSTALHFQESSFPVLHVVLTASSANGGSFAGAPQMVRGASVPPSREAQTLFTVAAQTSTMEQRGRQTVAHFHLPERIPIERVSFVLDPKFTANFSRDVLVSSHPPGTPSTTEDSISGTIQRVKMTRGDHDISEQQLSVAATLGANLQDAAEIEVAVNNGDDPPLKIGSVELEMRQRDLCFQAIAGERITLFYGDSQISAPVYDLARIYTPSAHSAAARLGPEELNPAWHPRPDTRPYTERHPHLLWIALLLVVGSLAFVAFHHPGTRLH